MRADDFVVLPCSHDLIRAGLDYACRSLQNLHLRPDNAGYAQIRRVASGAAVELAFRRYLVEQGIPFNVAPPAAFTDPNRFVVTLRGRRCDLRSFLITDEGQVTAMGADPAQLLDVPALVPVEDYADEAKSPDDLYVFGVVPALVHKLPACCAAAPENENAPDLIHLLPADWAHPRAWAPLRPLTAKSEGGSPVSIEIGGQDGSRQPLVYRLELPGGARVELDADFYNVTHARVQKRPVGRVGLHSAARTKTLIIERGDWHDVSFVAREILLLGWLRRDEFRQRASLVKAGSRVFQFARTRIDNLAVRVADLKPIPPLLERVASSA